jgi:signal transduction histidine kinase
LRDVARATLEQNRMDRTGMPLTPEDFDDLRLLFEPETARMKQQLAWKVSGTAQGFKDFAAAPVRQIALNLLLNASAAAGEGGKIGFEAGQDDDGLTLKITDSGPGMPEPALVRLLTSDEVQPGGGVGLRLVRDMALAVGGDVAYARDAGRSEVTVSLRRQQVQTC